MTRTLGLLAIVSMAVYGCGKKGDDDSGTSTGTATGGSCTATVAAFPAPGANDVYYRTTIEFEMSAVETDAAISVMTGGAAVAGSTEVIDSRVVFTPDAPLDSTTTYDVTLDWSCGPTTSSFTTSDIGPPIADPSTLIGNTYALDLAAGRWVEPAGVGSLIGGLLDQEIALGVTNADASILHIMGALGDGAGGQDMCTESFDFPVDADFTANPYFAVSSPLLSLDIQGVAVDIEDMEVSGAFSPNADRIAGASLKGTLDVSILADLVGSDPCALLVTFGVSCQTCSDGVTETCLSVLVDSMSATQMSGVTLEEITPADIDCNAACGTPATTCP